MRPLTIAGALLALAACIGAAFATRRGGGAPAADSPARAANPQQVVPPPAGDPIDKDKKLPLTPVRAPAGFGEAAFAHVQALCALGPRTPGSEKRPATPGWTRQLTYIEDELKQHGITPVRDTWTDRKELITFTNLSATLPGKSKDRILLCCHHDTKCTQGHPDPAHNFDFVGANDGASGVAALLALAPVLAAGGHEATIELVFFDGEESLDWKWNDAVRALFGSKRYVQRHREAQLVGGESRIAAVVLLDMVGRTDMHLQEELYSTPELRTIQWSAAVACGHDAHFFKRAAGACDDHVPFLLHGIPAVDLIDLDDNPFWHTEKDTVEFMSPQSLQVTGDVVLTMLPEIERTYVAQKR
ncbi:MAG: M28 family peptidase [Planctomycetota bacterium]